MQLTRLICIFMFAIVILGSSAQAADPEKDQPNPCASKPAEEPKPAGPKILCRLALLEINSTDAWLPIPDSYEASGPSPQSLEEPVAVLVNPNTHPMNFGVILTEKGHSIEIGGVHFDTSKRTGIPDNPKKAKDGEEIKWELLSKPTILTKLNMEAQVTVGEEIPIVTIQPDGSKKVSYVEIGFKLILLPIQVKEEAVHFKHVSITRTYFTHSNWLKSLEFRQPLSVRNDFSIEMPMTIPYNRCAVFQLPFAPYDRPLFAFLSVSMQSESKGNPSSQPISESKQGTPQNE